MCVCVCVCVFYVKTFGWKCRLDEKSRDEIYKRRQVIKKFKHFSLWFIVFSINLILSYILFCYIGESRRDAMSLAKRSVKGVFIQKQGMFSDTTSSISNPNGVVAAVRLRTQVIYVLHVAYR